MNKREMAMVESLHTACTQTHRTCMFHINSKADAKAAIAVLCDLSFNPAVDVYMHELPSCLVIVAPSIGETIPPPANAGKKLDTYELRELLESV